MVGSKPSPEHAGRTTLDRGAQHGAPMDRCRLWTLRKAISDDQFKDPLVILDILLSDGQIVASIWEV